MNERKLPFEGDDKNLITDAGDRMKSSFLKVLKEVVVDGANINPDASDPAKQPDIVANNSNLKP